MPFTYQIEPTAGLLLVINRGEVTQADRLETMHAWLHDRAYQPSLNTLCDCTEAASLPSLSELREIVGFMRTHAEAIGRKKLAFVTGNQVTFAVARQFQAFLGSDPVRVELFDDRDTALAWLREGA
jgi:hypothetical protein